jgi:hypothetical protein
MAVVGHKRGHPQIFAHRMRMQVQTTDDFCLSVPRCGEFLHLLMHRHLPGAPRTGCRGLTPRRLTPSTIRLGRLRWNKGRLHSVLFHPAFLPDGAHRPAVPTFSGSLLPDFSAHASDQELVWRTGRLVWRLCGNWHLDHDRLPRLQHARVTIGSRPPRRCPSLTSTGRCCSRSTSSVPA